MKNRTLPRQAKQIQSAAKTVQFILHGAKAKKVALAGNFNNWNADANPLKLTAGQCWIGELTLPPGSHEYQFVVDGQWMPDPNAYDYIPNPYGGANSVVQVSG